MLKRFYLLLMIVSFSFPVLLAGDPPTDPPKDPPPASSEGMWLPINLNYEHMKALGLQLEESEIYSEDNPSIKDAIVQMGNFCTGEIISPEGLMLTNHHCGYDAIATLSTVENDYLTDGFWAMSKKEELPVEGLTVTFLVRMEDVTARVLADGATPGSMEAMEAISTIEEEAGADNDYRVEVKEVFHGSEYYLYIYKTYRDVRFVGAPPSSIGKYGGDTDNWMWPRHTGDFSMFRVYAGPDNEPADYSAENVPYRPKHYLPVSLNGVQEDDYAMILGYPGSTSRYLSSDAVDFALKHTNPDRIKLMNDKLTIMKKAMDADDQTRINMASNYASLSNYHKYLIGQSLMLNRYKIPKMKEREEREFMKWVNADADREAKYGSTLESLDKLYAGYGDTDRWLSYLFFGVFGPDVVNYAVGYYRLWRQMEGAEEESAYMPAVDNLKEGVDAHFDEYYANVDKDIFYQLLLDFYNDVPMDQHPEVMTEIMDSKAARKGKTPAEKLRMWTDFAFKTSVTTDKERANAFLANPSFKVLSKDPIVYYVVEMINTYRSDAAIKSGGFEAQTEELNRSYIQGLREMHPDKKFYPDANSTMRVTFGSVKPYYPRDAVFYDFFTTADGIMEKEDPNNDEFIVPDKLQDLVEKQDFGRYGHNGNLPVNFLTTNDITGGNSGSPVLNAKGELIGVAFDGNWEAMASDIQVFPEVTRTISVDIRYVLFIVEKFAGADNIIKELTIMQD